MSKSGWVRSIGPLLVLLIAVLLAIIFIASKKPPEQKEVVTKDFLVEAQVVNREATAFVVSSQGNVVPKNQTRISAQVSGQVVSLADVFEVGGMFKKGDVLAVLEQTDYETELKLAEAELAQAVAALQEEIARGKVAETEWRSVNSKVPPELGLRKPQLASEQANVKAAEAKLERARRNLDRTEIKAPYNGIVIARNIDLGQFVSSGSEVGTLYSTDVAEVRLPITESELAYIDLQAELANNTAVVLSAKVAGQRQHWQAKLVRTEGILDSGSRVIYAVAQINDPYNMNKDPARATLRFGQFAEAEITGTQSQPLYVLPRSVLRLDNSILTVSDENTLQINDVEVIRATAKHVYINDGLPEQPKVVFSVVPNPYEGMKVRISGEELQQEDDTDADSIELNVTGGSDE
ncbi:efflux RND transporter periplasmic adaptor subunit [Alteromonas confluentis]|uniref:Efflux transporter periplasmic adaptor subunit n=1 Tax=Alteromonas confluentis TaxID=1656094 RepID=A0A1E7Z5M9_9ALTE|nr:efflux RND transporter periplasmic adaptor subunit [Alteromonas confluentis]OFC68711.1 efflux transporter periplasmic adaptor subunit [Alteromonas confluentis]